MESQVDPRTANSLRPPYPIQHVGTRFAHSTRVRSAPGPGPNDRPIRIVFLITQFEAGGAQSQLALRLQNIDLTRFDCRVALLTDVTSHLLDTVLSLGIPVDILHVDREATLWRRVRVIRDYLRKEQADVVNTCLTWDHVHGAIGAALAGVPVIVSELQNVVANLRHGFPPVLQFLEFMVLSFISDRIVCCSDAVHRSYRRWVWGFHRKATVIKNSIDPIRPHVDRETARAALGLPQAPLVGAMGRLAEQKDLQTLLRAMKLLRDSGCEARLAIAGDGPQREALIADAAALGLASHVRFLGNVADPLVFFAAIDVFAMSSRWEGLPVVLLEAMAAGRAAVCTDVGGTREALLHGETGLLCQPGDAAALATHLGRLLSDAGLRRQMAARARHRSAQFDVHGSIKRWQAVYQEGQCTKRSERRRRHWPDTANRILLFRLCPLEQLLDLVSQLRARYPAATIDCICQTDWAARLQEEGVNAIAYGLERFSMRALGVRTLRGLRAVPYDLIVVPFNHRSRVGYLEAEVCALLVGGTRAVGVVPSRDGLPLPEHLSYWTALTVRIGSDSLQNATAVAAAIRG